MSYFCRPDRNNSFVHYMIPTLKLLLMAFVDIMYVHMHDVTAL